MQETLVGDGEVYMEGKTTYKGCVIRPAKTVGHWGSIPWGTNGKWCRNCPLLLTHPKSRGAEVFISKLSLVIGRELLPGSTNSLPLHQ